MVGQTQWMGGYRRGAFKRFPVIMALILAGVLMSGCGSSMELSSTWTDNGVPVDGDASHWKTGLTKLKDSNVFLGVQNDNDYVYVCLTSPDRQFRRQLIGSGLSVWFENEKGTRSGVLFPIGMMRQEEQPLPDEEEGRDPGDRERDFQQALRDLEVLGPGKDDRNLFSTVQVPGVSVKVGGLEGSTVYELKMPLAKSGDHPYAVDARPGSVVKVELQTGKIESGARPGGGREGMRGGRMPRGGGMGGEGMGRGGEGSGERIPRGTRPEPLDVSVKVQLATSAQGPGQAK